MIDKTNAKLENRRDFNNLFLELLSAGEFGEAKTVDIKIKPVDYLSATQLTMGISPMRFVVGDYTMRLHCQA